MPPDAIATTEAPDPTDPPPGVASDPPFAASLVVTLGAFAAVTWGMMALFGVGPGGRRQTGDE